MRKLFFLVAAAALSAACHNRSDEEVGAAPDQGSTDTTAVTHVIDSTRTGPPGTQGRPGNATVTADSVGADSTSMQGGAMDSTSMGQDTSMTAMPQDTLGPRDTGADSSVQTDSSTMQTDSTTMPTDSTSADTTSTNQ